MTSIIINMKTAQGKKIQSKLTYLNDNATDTALYNLATAFASLTTNTFVDVQKISQSELDPSAKKSGKPTPPITLDISEGIPEYSGNNETTATEILLAQDASKNFFRLNTPYQTFYEEFFNAKVYGEDGDKHYNIAIETDGKEHIITIRPRNEIDAQSNGNATIRAFFPETEAYAQIDYDFIIKGE